MKIFRIEFSVCYTPLFSLLKFVVTLLEKTIFPDLNTHDSWTIINLDKKTKIFWSYSKSWMKALGRVTCLNEKELKGKYLFWAHGVGDELS